MKFHKLANMFPMMDGAEFDAFAADIKQNGLGKPITRYQGMILDGRNRFRGCKKAGVKPRFIDFKGKDPLAFVISENVHRRHLDETQRAMIARRMVTTKKGRQEKSNVPIGTFDLESAAQLFNVGRRSLIRAGWVLDKGTPELVRACDRGEVAVSKAASLAKKPAKEQNAFLTKPDKPKVPAEKRKTIARGTALIAAWDAATVEQQLHFVQMRIETVHLGITTILNKFPELKKKL